jgi:hypothetical protein
VEFLRRHPGTGNLLNEFAWGGYCLWRLHPDQTVFIDGRAQVYLPGTFGEYSRLAALEDGWIDLLDQRHIDTVLVPPGAAIAGALPLLSGWSEVYRDERAVVFRRQL